MTTKKVRIPTVVLLVFSAVVLGAGPAGHRAQREHDPVTTSASLAPYVEMLNELASRRRTSLLFANIQLPTFGVQVGRVNLSKGNTTFVRRDLSVVAPIPIIIARVYDSSLTEEGGFGQRWHLSMAEWIEIGDGTATWLDDSGAHISLVQVATDEFAVDPRIPTDVLQIRRTDGDVVVRFKDGWLKRFRTVLNDRLRLSEIMDAANHSLTFQYNSHGLTRVSSDSGRHVDIIWSDDGHIVAARDDLGREVRYAYNGSGLLSEVIDIAGHRWMQEYGASGRLTGLHDSSSMIFRATYYEDSGRTRLVADGGHTGTSPIAAPRLS